MTTTDRYKIQKSHKKISLSRQTVIASLMCLFILLLLLKNSSVATASVKHGLSLCVGNLIPSLFPFMIISELVVRSGLASYGAKLLSIPSRKLFGLCGEAGCAFLVGTLCGFPIGAVMGMSLYNRGILSRGELLRLLCFSSNPGAAFTIITLGREHLGNLSLGILLYSVICLSAVSVGIISKYLINESDTKEQSKVSFPQGTPKSVATLFTDSVKASSLAMLYICGFVVFFSTIVGSLDSVLFSKHPASGDNIIRPLLFGFFELTSGVFSVDASLSAKIILPICGAILGFSGLSVHFQIMSVCNRSEDNPLPIFHFLFMKILQAAIASLVLLVVAWLFFS